MADYDQNLYVGILKVEYAQIAYLVLQHRKFEGKPLDISFTIQSYRLMSLIWFLIYSFYFSKTCFYSIIMENKKSINNHRHLK